MKVLNIHKRIIQQPKAELVKLIKTLSSQEDLVWPHEHWPRMKLDNGLQPGSKGGHGPIGYFVKDIILDKIVRFEFTAPTGFYGAHWFEIQEMEKGQTTLIHTIQMNTNLKGTFLWMGFVRWLHDALVEDAFDKVENHFDHQNRKTQWSWWVTFCRNNLKPKK